MCFNCINSTIMLNTIINKTILVLAVTRILWYILNIWFRNKTLLTVGHEKRWLWSVEQSSPSSIIEHHSIQLYSGTVLGKGPLETLLVFKIMFSKISEKKSIFLFTVGHEKHWLWSVEQSGPSYIIEHHCIQLCWGTLLGKGTLKTFLVVKIMFLIMSLKIHIFVHRRTRETLAMVCGTI